MRHVTSVLAACLLLLTSSALANDESYTFGDSVAAVAHGVIPSVLVRSLVEARDSGLPPTYNPQFFRRAHQAASDTNDTAVASPGPDETPGAYTSPPDGQPTSYGNDTTTIDDSPSGTVRPGSNHTTHKPPRPPAPKEKNNTLLTKTEIKTGDTQSTRVTGAAAATAGVTVVSTSTMSAMAGAAAGNVAATAVGGAVTTAVAGGATSAAASGAVATSVGAVAGGGASAAAGSAVATGVGAAAGTGVGGGAAAAASAGGAAAGGAASSAAVSAGTTGVGASVGGTTAGAGGTAVASTGGTSTLGTGGVAQMTSSSKLASALDINQYMSQGPLVTMFHHLQMIQLISDGLDTLNPTSTKQQEVVQFYRQVSGSLEWVVFRYRDDCMQRAKQNGTEAQAQCLWRAGKGQAMILGIAFVVCMCMHAVVLLIFVAACCKERCQPPTLLAFPNVELLLMSIMVIPVTQCAVYLLSAAILGGLAKAWILGGIVVGFLLFYASAILTIVTGVVGRRDIWGLTYILNPFARSFRSHSRQDQGCSVFAIVSGGCHVDLSQWHGSWNVDDILMRSQIRAQYNVAGGGFPGFVSRAISQARDYLSWRKQRLQYSDLSQMDKSAHQPAQADTWGARDQQVVDSASAKVIIPARIYSPDQALRVEMDDRLGAAYLDYKGETGLHSSWHLIRLMYQVGIAALLASSRVSTDHSKVLLWSGCIWQLTYAILVLVIQPYCNRWFGLLEAVCQFLQTANVFMLALMASTEKVYVSKEIFLYISLSSVAVTMLGSWLRIVAMFWRIEGLYFVIKRPRVLKSLHSITATVAPCTAPHFKHIEEAADELEDMRTRKMAVEMETMAEMTSEQGWAAARQGAGYHVPLEGIPESSSVEQSAAYGSGHMELRDSQMVPPHQRDAYR